MQIIPLKLLVTLVLVGVLPHATGGTPSFKKGDSEPMTVSFSYLLGGHEVVLEESRRDEPVNALEDCLEHVVDRLRTYVDDEWARSVLATAATWVFTFDPPASRDFGPFGNVVLARVLVPVTGEFAVRSDAPVITLLTEFTSGGWLAWHCKRPPGDGLALLQTG